MLEPVAATLKLLLALENKVCMINCLMFGKEYNLYVAAIVFHCLFL